jgi:hypothetical protein
MVSLIQATIGPVLGPLVAELAASRQVNERQAEQLAGYAAMIAELREDRGRLTAELEALKASRSPVAASETAPGVRPSLRPQPAPWWRRWLVAVYG